jgi:hypothetical protein
VKDEIFDYFAGNSPRKIEPLDESELFDDLFPPALSQAGVQAESVAETEKHITTSDVNPPGDEQRSDSLAEYKPDQDWDSDSQFAAGSDVVLDEASDEAQSATAPISHWDHLALQLGLTPKPVPTKPSQPKPDSRARRSSRTRPEYHQPAETVSRPGSSRDTSRQSTASFAAEEPAEAASPSSAADIFIPDYRSLSEEAVAGEQVVDDDFDVDPFATFHNLEATRESVDLFDDDSEDSAELKADDELAAAGDFVEFEVKDLESGRGSNSARPRRRRRSHSRPTDSRQSVETESRGSENRRTDLTGEEARGSRSRPAESSEAETTKSAARGEEPRSSQSRGAESRGSQPSRGQSPRSPAPASTDLDADEIEEEREFRPRRRSRARKSQSEMNSAASTPSAQESDTDWIEPTDIEKAVTKKQGARSVESDQDQEAAVREEKMRPRVPTWDAAIGRIVDGNIRRHKSGAGRSGKRHRN